MQPQGVSYDKAYEGVIYQDGKTRCTTLTWFEEDGVWHAGRHELEQIWQEVVRGGQQRAKYYSWEDQENCHMI